MAIKLTQCNYFDMKRFIFGLIWICEKMEPRSMRQIVVYDNKVIRTNILPCTDNEGVKQKLC